MTEEEKRRLILLRTPSPLSAMQDALSTIQAALAAEERSRLQLTLSPTQDEDREP